MSNILWNKLGYLLKALLLHTKIQSSLSVLGGKRGWFQDSHGYQNLTMLKSLI